MSDLKWKSVEQLKEVIEHCNSEIGKHKGKINKL